MNNTTYKAYIAEITKYPLLTAEQEKSLSKRIQQGDKEAEQLLINSNLRYVVSIAHKYTKNEEILLDCIQEGSLGLMVAALKFDYRFNTRFCTYASPWITQYILRHKNLIEPTIHIPVLKLEKLKTIKKAHNALEQLLCKKPSNHELSIYTGIPEDEIRELSNYDYKVCSIDSKAESEDEPTILQFLYDERENPEEEAIVCSERQEFMSLIQELPVKERYVMTHRYNSYITGSKTSYKSMGSKLGVSIEATRQIEKRAKIKLQNIFESHFEMSSQEKIPV